MDFQEKKSVVNPRVKANPLSIVFFWWIFPLFRRSAKKELDVDDLYDVLKEDRSGRIGDELQRVWDLECEKARKANKKPSFLSALLKVYWKRYAVLGLTMMLDEWVIRVSQTWMLYKLIQAFGRGDEATELEKYLYGTGICLTTFLHTVTLHPTVFEMSHFGMKCRVSCCSVIYRKALRLSKAAQNQTTVGQLVNLLSNDVNRFDVNVMFLHYLYLGPVQACIFMYLLWDIGEFGTSVLAGVGFIVLLIPLQYWIGKLFTVYRFQIAQRTDKRGQIMNEIIIAMRVIKMYAWEKPFSALIAELRRLEVKILRKAAFLRAFYLSLFISSSKLITYLTVLAFILQGGELKADRVFFMVSIYNVMRQIMISFIPSAAAHIGELMVSINRIQDFLLLDENKSTDTLKIYKSLGVQEDGEEGTSVMAASVVMNNVTAKWTNDKVTLDNLNLNLRGDRLVMVVGPVGSGKTSFLHALISELPIASGTCVINGSTSYASQEPWIFTGNLRQNVLFGQDYNDDRYRDVIRVSALEEDLRQLPFGENTIVGERGVALSGGQKARVNLARALYHKADIYLLDDPLSAVDARVSRHIFEKCVKQHLKGHLRILVTHQLQYLPQADHVIVLSSGKIQAQGTYTELVEQGIDFVSLMASETEEDSQRKDSLRRGSLLLPEAALGLARMGSRRKSKPIVEEKVVHVETENKEKPVAVAETMAGGSVTGRTYWDYFAAGGSYVAIILLLLGFVASQALVTAADIWLSKWTSDTKDHSDNCQPPTCTEKYDYDFNFWVYTGMIVALFVVTNIRSIYFFQYCMDISINVHNRMFGSMVRAPIKFFDDNPSGRIMNRFTKDIGAMDELLPTTFFDAFSIFLLMLGIMVNIIISNYYIGIPAIILMVALVFIRRFFIRTARHVKRVEAVTRSPVFTHLAATLQGLTTIRALGAEKTLAYQFDGHQDIHSSAWYTYIAANRWFGVWLEMASLVFLCLVTYSFMVLGDVLKFSDSQIGLAISSTLGLLGTFQWGMRQSAETENLMTSVERAMEYAKLNSEAPLDSTSDKKPPKDWPEYGEVRFDNMSLAYGEKDVLKELSFTIRGREKIGIVGRTGAGKSSIIAGVFRMTEPRGKVFIDKINIGEIGLHDLRQNISIIPQDPVLFSGTVRYNMDPFNKYDDNLIWAVLEEIGLKEDIPALDFEVSDGGSNFSVGQRQLVCLGRAILRRNKIIVMDEATANVDPETDGFIQTTIRQKFHDCTIITIAHRLHSVMDCDKILVLDNGYLKEYDHPHVLLQNSSGILTSMVSHTGKASAEILKQVAKDTFMGRRGSFQVDNVSVLSFARRQSIISDVILSESSDSDSDNPDGGGEPEMHPVEKHFRDAGLFLDDEDSGSDSQEAQQSEVPED